MLVLVLSFAQVAHVRENLTVDGPLKFITEIEVLSDQRAVRAVTPPHAAATRS